MQSSRRAFIRRAIVVGGSATAVNSGGGRGDALAQPSGVRSFDHVALPMQNVDAMFSFYRALGFR